jgi:hypothetical protein
MVRWLPVKHNHRLALQARQAPGVTFQAQRDFSACRVIQFSFQYEIRREAADSATARQGEATTYRIEMEMEMELALRLRFQSEPQHA